MEFQVLPGAHGWVSGTVRSGESFVEIGPFSHALTEGIDDLVRGTASILCGAWEQTFSMDDEPEPIWQWRLKRELLWQPKRYELSVTIRRIDDVVAGVGEDVFQAVCDPDGFGRAVVAAMHGGLSRDTPEALQERWPPFPKRAIVALEAALAVPEEAIRPAR